MGKILDDPKKVNFDLKVSDHRYWREKGLDLKQTAEFIEGKVGERFDVDRNKLGLESSRTVTEVRHGLLDVYAMVLGYSMECFLKALLVRKLLRGKSHHRFGEDNLFNKSKTHDLCNLAISVNFGLSERESKVLKHLEKCVVWAGRYPIPTSAIELSPRIWTEGDFEKARKLLQRLSSKNKN